MIQSNVSDNPSEAIRKEIFQALVEAQDQRMSVAQSRTFIAGRFNISESQVRQIEQEGLDQQWPPLGRKAEGVLHRRCDWVCKAANAHPTVFSASSGTWGQPNPNHPSRRHFAATGSSPVPGENLGRGFSARKVGLLTLSA